MPETRNKTCNVSTLRKAYRFLRLTKHASLLFGPRYRRSRSLIEIDITYSCNMRCLNCDRSCRQAPSEESMTVAQIGKFTQESRDKGIKWERIRVLGGEPTNHPDLLKILDVLLEYKNTYSPETKIELWTNGFGENAAETLKKVPQDLKIQNSHKTSGLQAFEPFNLAPQDSLLNPLFDYSLGCHVTENCGMGLTPYGYYPCAASGGIDRIFGYNLGRKELPDFNEEMTDQMRAFCRLCGHYATYMKTIRTEEVSPTWKKAYESYSKKKFQLDRY